MNKILRTSFVALLAMMFGNVMADNVTWDLSKKTYNDDASADKVTWSSDYATMTVEKASASTAANNYLGGDANNRTSSRFYKNSKLTIAPASGYQISSLVFTATSDNYATAFQESTWTNAAAVKDGTKVTVTPTVGTNEVSAVISGTCGFTEVVVNYSSSSDTRTATTIEFSGDYETWFAPSGPFDETYPVATATVKAGDTPIDAIVTWTVEKKDDWAAYEGEGELTVADGKVSGIHKKSFGTLTLTASFAGDQANKPSTKSYDIKVCKIPNRIQDFYEWYGNKKENIAKGMPVCYFLIDLDENDTPTPRQELVTYVKGANTYITDGKQGLLLYKSNLGLAVGDKITVAGATKADPIWGTLKSFNGTIEIAVDHMGVVKSSTGNEVTPIEITVDKITALDNFFTNWQGGHMTPLNENVFLSNYVTIKDAEYVGTSGSNEQFKVGDATFLVYKNGANVTFEATAKYTLTGVGSSYNKVGDITPQLNYISSEKTAEPSGINNVMVEAKAGKVYNLQGQRMEKAQKGLYIVDGKKIMVK